MTDADRLAELLARLPVEDAAFVAAIVAPPWVRRAARLRDRDAAIREALKAHANLPPTAAAEALAMELRRAVACPHARGDRAVLLARIIALSGGRPLAWRRIVDLQKKPDRLQPDQGMVAP